MNIKFLITLSLLTIVCSCKQVQEEEIPQEANTSEGITQKEIAKFKIIEFTLDPKTDKIIKNWQAYYQISDVVENVKKGDLSFFNDNKDGIQTLLEELETSIPAQVDNNATQARLLTLKTKLYKLESLANISTTSKKELSKAIKEFLESFSNLNFQMNKKIEKDNQNIVKP